MVHASPGEITVALGAYSLGQFVGAPLWGKLSDRYGRRPVLLVGMGAYVMASTACAFAPSMDWLIAGRILQGIAMGAAVMAARAVVRDLYGPVDGARVMSKALTGLGVIACLCAPLGGLLTDLAGWRSALLALTVFGGLTWCLLWFRFRETLREKNNQAFHPPSLLRAWMEILRNPTFRAYCALSATS